MDNKEFWTSISTIINNGFDSEGIKKLEQYATHFITHRLLFQRYTEDEQSGCATGGALHVIASILAGAETSSDRLTATEFDFKREQQRGFIRQHSLFVTSPTYHYGFK